MKTAGRAIGVLAAASALLTGVAIAVAGPVQKQQGATAAVVHADVTRTSARGVTRELTLDRGAVTASSATSISLQRTDGQNVTLAVAPSTKVRGAPTVGAKVLVLSRGGTALLVRARAAGAPVTAPRAMARVHGLRLLRGAVHVEVKLIRADGSTDDVAFDRGQITAATASQVTLKRKDGKSVTLAVDSSTKVREQGKPAGLADLHAGDRAAILSRAGTAFLIRASAKT